MTGPLEPTNEAYASPDRRRRHGEHVSQTVRYDYVTVVPTSLYGPGDNFDPTMSRGARDWCAHDRGA
jgi:GDP-L-fucose synthase